MGRLFLFHHLTKLHLKSAAGLYHFHTEIGYILCQLFPQLLPILALERALHIVEIVGDPTGQDLRLIPILSKPGLRGLNSDPLHAWNEISHNKLKIFLFHSWKNVPGHNHFDVV